jgi:hypothetical protein
MELCCLNFFEKSINGGEPIQTIDFKNKDTNAPLTEIQTIISKSRNTEIKPLFNHFEEKRNYSLSGVCDIFPILLLSKIRKLYSI